MKQKYANTFQANTSEMSTAKKVDKSTTYMHKKPSVWRGFGSGFHTLHCQVWNLQCKIQNKSVDLYFVSEFMCENLLETYHVWTQT